MGVISKSLSQSLKRQTASEYVHKNAKICNSWNMFNCKKLFKLQIKPPSLLLLITYHRIGECFPSEAEKWEINNNNNNDNNNNFVLPAACLLYTISLTESQQLLSSVNFGNHPQKLYPSTWFFACPISNVSWHCFVPYILSWIKYTLPNLNPDFQVPYHRVAHLKLR
jgi:hypothetical protein